MKTRYGIIITIVALFILSLVYVNVDATVRGRPIQSNIKSGIYVPKDAITVPKLKDLPIPSTNDNYAFYQSIDKISNIVIGTFNSGERRITLIQDKNADGKVDTVAHLFVDLKRINVLPKPEEYCSAKQFEQYKEDIVNGNIENISPNPEGTSYLKELLKTPANIVRVKHGFKVYRTDTDEPTKERVSYFFSHRGISGADIVFEVRYYNRGAARVSPLIDKGVYCINSKDTFAIKVAKEYIKKISKHIYN